MGRLQLVLTSLATAMIVAACASTSENGTTGAGVALQIENNLLPPTTLTVYAVPEAGVRQLLGTVRPNRTATLTVDGVGPGQYRFLARTTEGREITSNAIAFGINDAVLWDIDTNLVTPL